MVEMLPRMFERSISVRIRIEQTRSKRAGEVVLERMRRRRLQVKASWWKLGESKGKIKPEEFEGEV
jgi:hypothetical protein